MQSDAKTSETRRNKEGIVLRSFWKRFFFFLGKNRKAWKRVFTCVCVYINNEAGLSGKAGSFVTLAS